MLLVLFWWRKLLTIHVIWVLQSFLFGICILLLTYDLLIISVIVEWGHQFRSSTHFSVKMGSYSQNIVKPIRFQHLFYLVDLNLLNQTDRKSLFLIYCHHWFYIVTYYCINQITLSVMTVELRYVSLLKWLVLRRMYALNTKVR